MRLKRFHHLHWRAWTWTFWAGSTLTIILIFLWQPSDSSPAQIKLHLQLSQHQHYTQLEVIYPHQPALRQRFQHVEAPLSWPHLLHQPIDTDFPVYFLSGLEANPKQGLILYDQWNLLSKLDHPVQAFNTEDKGVTLLIDRSGTMDREEGADNLNALARIYRQCLNLRKSDPRPWRILSFSDNLEDHGQWESRGPIPISAFAKSRGSTHLLSAIQKTLAVVEGPQHLVIISDGESDTRDRASIERQLGQAIAQGHRIHLLSPDMNPIPSWSSFYQRGLLDDQWPQPRPVRPLTDEVFHHEQSDSLWSGIINTKADKNHLPLLLNDQGQVLLYLEMGTQGMIFHAVAQLQSSPQNLIRWLQNQYTIQPTLCMDGQTIQVDLGVKSLEPLAITHPESQWLPAISPGLFSLPQPKVGRAHFYHPQTGPFILNGLEHWPELRQSPHLKNRWAFSLHQLGRPLGSIQQFLLVIIVLLQIATFFLLWRPRLYHRTIAHIYDD